MPQLLSKHAAAAGCLVFVVVLAGCSGVPFLGSSCGPGGTTIDSIDGNASDITIEGNLTAIHDASLVVDDGTGTAEILLLNGSGGEQFELGDCLVANGSGAESAVSDEDIVMIAQNLSEKE